MTMTIWIAYCKKAKPKQQVHFVLVMSRFRLARLGTGTVIDQAPFPDGQALLWFSVVLTFYQFDATPGYVEYLDN